jgi:hypothetical protein
MSAVLEFPTAPKAAPAAVERRYTPPSIAGDYTELTDKQKKLLAIASELGRNKFAPRAFEIDRKAVFPFDNYADLREAGLLGICVPEQYGGWGADFATYVMTAAEIGRHCGATALSLNMHVSSTMWTGLIADDLDMTPEQRANHEATRVLHYKRVIEGGKIFLRAALPQQAKHCLAHWPKRWTVATSSMVKRFLHRCQARPTTTAFCAPSTSPALRSATRST